MYHLPDEEGSPVCDICGEKIQPGEKYYDFPDGFTVCCDSECVSIWKDDYETTAPQPAV